MALQPNQNIGGQPGRGRRATWAISYKTRRAIRISRECESVFLRVLLEVLSKAIGYFVVCEFLIGMHIVEIGHPVRGGRKLCYAGKSRQRQLYGLRYLLAQVCHFYDTTEVPEEFASTMGAVTAANTNTAPANNGFQRNSYQNPYLPRRGITATVKHLNKAPADHSAALASSYRLIRLWR